MCRWVVVLTLICGSCVSPNYVQCAGGGGFCPADRVCATVDGDVLCVLEEQIAACMGKPDQTPCATGNECHEGVCLPVGCGNGRHDSLEACDDGNQIAGDGCASDCQSDETCGNGVIDRSEGEQCDDHGIGHALSHDGCSSDCTLEFPQWVTVVPLANSGPLRAVYDARRDRIVAVRNGHTWEWDGARWLYRATTQAPAARTGSALAYDASRGVVVMYGGIGFDDTWEWDGASWTRMLPAGDPGARYDHAMAYDPRRKRVILVGGVRSGASAATLGDTWAWDGNGWTQLADGPLPRKGAALAYDEQRDTLVLFGGRDTLDGPLDDTWELSADQWVQRTPMLRPSPRSTHAMVFDPQTRRIVLHGGTGSAQFDDSWTWDGTAWTSLGGGIGWLQPTLVAVTRRAELILIGGNARMFRWTGSAWATVVDRIESREFDLGSPAVAADLAGRIVVFGGLLGGSVPVDSTLVWQGQWIDRTTTVMPPPLVDAAMTYDTQRDEFVLFGGNAGGGPQDATWVFDGATWEMRTPPTSPPARAGHAMIFDTRRGQLLLFGGQGADSNPLGDTWLWDGATWTQVLGDGPSPRQNAALGYDPITGTAVLFGGKARLLGEQLRDTWVWNGTAWTAPAVSGPSARSLAAMAWDPARRALVLVGGLLASTSLGDVWEWTGTTWNPIQAVGRFAGRSSHALVSAPGGAGVLVIGGGRSGSASIDPELAWLTWRTLGREDTCTNADDGNLDRDLDGDRLIGCGVNGGLPDPDCWQVCRPSCLPGVAEATCAGAAACGDGTCDGKVESCVTCPIDCGACPQLCGDLVCDGSETVASCPSDCP